MLPFLRMETLTNHTLHGGTYLSSPYMGVAPSPGDKPVRVLQFLKIVSLQVQAGVAMSLGSLRLDRLFDYGARLSDQASSVIVLKHYNRLHSAVKPLLDKRNKQRFQEGYLTYPYLSPAWIPNSICT